VASAHEVVEHADLADPFVDELVDDVRSDQPGAAGDQDC
jgi:hypothetical protein